MSNLLILVYNTIYDLAFPYLSTFISNLERPTHFLSCLFTLNLHLAQVIPSTQKTSYSPPPNPPC